MFLGAGTAASATSEGRPLEEQGYLGLLVRDHPETGGCIVGWILPGPLQGRGFRSPLVDRDDLILAVNGEAMDAVTFNRFVRESRPGDEVVLTVQRTRGARRGAMPQPGEGTGVEDVNGTLASRAEWVGPIAHTRPGDSPPDPDEMIAVDGEATPLEAFIIDRLREQEIESPVIDLIEFFGETLERDRGHHMLSRVAFGFERPMRLPELQKLITDPLPAVAADPRRVLHVIADNLDLAQPQLEDAVDLSDPQGALEAVAERMARAGALVKQAFAGLDEQTMQRLPGAMDALVEVLARGVYFMHHERAPEFIRAMQATMEVEFDALLGAAAALSGLMPRSEPPPEDAPAVEIPEELRDAVVGEVLAVLERDGRWLVYGGFGDNEYDMSRLDAVIDPGGDDVYRYPETGGDEKRNVQVIIDMAGDDRHIAQAPGPASASIGVSLLVDYEGNDRYEGGTRSSGAGVLGVGILLDYAGNDVYAGTSWSQGAAFYGAGVVLDLGPGSDVFTAEVMSQGLGGPRGLGMILNESGRNLYRANGPAPSGYGTPAVYRAFSQGVGFGVRMYDTGGIGILADLSGDDRYEGGEFSQGGGYSWGLGILYDRSGNDMYYGNRYSQGWAAHQALGVLADDEGDDTYWAMTAACQGAAWDIAMGMLIDRAGNDSYQADGLSQGAASMQAIGWLIDLAGTDRYIGRGATHGRSGGDAYHHDRSGCFSWSLHLDAGGTDDHYSTGRPNGAILSTGTYNEDQPEHSTLHGLFINTTERIDFGP